MRAMSKIEIFLAKPRQSLRGVTDLLKYGHWYWRLRARNGRIVAVGGEGFTRSADARRAARRARAIFAGLPVF